MEEEPSFFALLSDEEEKIEKKEKVKFSFFAPKRKPLGGLARATGPMRQASIKNETFCDILLATTATRPKERKRQAKFQQKTPFLILGNHFERILFTNLLA